MKNLFDFVIKSDECTIRGKGKTIKQVKEEVNTLEVKYG